MPKVTQTQSGQADYHKQLADDYFPNPDKYRKAAVESGMTETELLESRIPPRHRSRSGASVVEVMMWHQKDGLDVVQRGYSNACSMIDYGNFTSDEYNKTTEAKLFWEWNEDAYLRTLETGCSPYELDHMPNAGRMPDNPTERLSSVSELAAQSPENP